MNSDPSSRAARSGIEAALFDLWGQIVKQPVSYPFSIYSHFFLKKFISTR